MKVNSTSALKDLHSNQVVGYSIDGRIKASLAVTALAHAVALRTPSRTTAHSGRGNRIRSRKVMSALHTSGLRGSMGRAGMCGDNAAMATFLALLQKNDLNRKPRETRQELRLASRT